MKEELSREEYKIRVNRVGDQSACTARRRVRWFGQEGATAVMW